jgi:hypothetical protein
MNDSKNKPFIEKDLLNSKNRKNSDKKITLDNKNE